jgi:Trk-type K+ transport system membrane component
MFWLLPLWPLRAVAAACDGNDSIAWGLFYALAAVIRAGFARTGSQSVLYLQDCMWPVPIVHHTLGR